MERQAVRAGIPSDRYWDQTLRATLIEIEADVWRWKRDKRIDAELTAALASVWAKKGKGVSGRDIMPELWEDVEEEEDWVSETMTKRAAQGAYLYFSTAAEKNVD